MKTLKFKTNIKCSGCIARVTPELDKTPGVKKWSVDILTPDKILSVDYEGNEPDSIISAVEKAGYKAEEIKRDN